jgi:putative flippase GtrA
LPDDFRTTLKQFISFGVIGVVGFVVDAGVLTMLLHVASAGFYVGRLVSFLCAVTVTWFLNRTFTFRAAAGALRSHHEWVRFLGANSLGGGVNLGVYSLLVAKVSVFAAHPVLAVGAGSLSGLLVNFSVTKAYVFRAARLAC